VPRLEGRDRGRRHGAGRKEGERLLGHAQRVVAPACGGQCVEEHDDEVLDLVAQPSRHHAVDRVDHDLGGKGASRTAGEPEGLDVVETLLLHEPRKGADRELAERLHRARAREGLGGLDAAGERHRGRIAGPVDELAEDLLEGSLVHRRDCRGSREASSTPLSTSRVPTAPGPSRRDRSVPLRYPRREGSAGWTAARPETTRRAARG
jgi:hypothetical protein